MPDLKHSKLYAVVSKSGRVVSTVEDSEFDAWIEWEWDVPDRYHWPSGCRTMQEFIERAQRRGYRCVRVQLTEIDE